MTFQKSKVKGDIISRDFILNWFSNLEIIKNNNPVKIIDTGAGAGHFSIKVGNLAPSGSNLTITDIDPESLEKNVKYHETKLSYNIKTIILDLTKEFPIDDSIYDIVISTGVIEHLVDTDKYIEEIFRILKPNGYLFLLAPNLSALQYRLLLLIGKQPTCLHPAMKQYNSPISKKVLQNIYYKHVSVFTHKGLLDFLKDKGFLIEKQKTTVIYFLPGFVSRFITWIRPYGIFSLVMAKKPIN